MTYKTFSKVSIYHKDLDIKIKFALALVCIPYADVNRILIEYIIRDKKSFKRVYYHTTCNVYAMFVVLLPINFQSHQEFCCQCVDVKFQSGLNDEWENFGAISSVLLSGEISDTAIFLKGFPID